MTTEQRIKFDELNKAWSILEPHVKDKDTYRTIMSDLFRMNFKKRGKEYSDEWWKDYVDEFWDYPKRYWDTPYFDFAGELAMGFLNYYEKRYKLNGCDFEKSIIPAFRKELQRIGKGQNRVSEAILPEPQTFHQEELHFPDPVS